MLSKTRSFNTALIMGFVWVALVGTVSGQSGRTAAGSGATRDLQSSEDASRAQAEAGGKVVIGANLVNVSVSVSDSQGRFVPGLNKDVFEVFDNGAKQQVVHFSDLDSPLSIGIVYDVSGSMGGNIERSAQALKRFLETSHDQDAFFLLTFNGRAALTQDFMQGDPASIVNGLASVKPNGQTALYDAIYMALEKIKEGPYARQALLVISDGQDNHSSRTFGELNSAVKESGVIIYTIGITGRSADRRPDVGRLVLDQIAETSGGRSFFPSPYDESGLMDDCSRIALELRRQYSIGFYPDGLTGETPKLHKIKVRIDAPRELGRLSLSYRASYQSFGLPHRMARH
jgi:Ca-activated chloride channel family protein